MSSKKRKKSTQETDIQVLSKCDPDLGKGAGDIVVPPDERSSSTDFSPPSTLSDTAGKDASSVMNEGDSHPFTGSSTVCDAKIGQPDTFSADNDAAQSSSCYCQSTDPSSELLCCSNCFRSLHKACLESLLLPDNPPMCLTCANRATLPWEKALKVKSEIDGMTVPQLRQACLKQHLTPKSSTKRKALSILYMDSYGTKLGRWHVYRKEGKSPRRVQEDADSMLSAMLAGSHSEQLKIIASFGISVNPRQMTAVDCRNWFVEYLTKITGCTPVHPRGPLYRFTLPPDSANSIYGWLFYRVQGLSGLHELLPHIMQHLMSNWKYHVAATRATKGSMQGFARHFMNGMRHWNGVHSECRTESGHHYQAGVFPITSNEADNVGLASSLFSVMKSVVEQVALQQDLLAHPLRSPLCVTWLQGAPAFPDILPFETVKDLVIDRTRAIFN